jgi:hypothetical protein
MPPSQKRVVDVLYSIVSFFSALHAGRYGVEKFRLHNPLQELPAVSIIRKLSFTDQLDADDSMAILLHGVASAAIIA